MAGLVGHHFGVNDSLGLILVMKLHEAIESRRVPVGIVHSEPANRAGGNS